VHIFGFIIKKTVTMHGHMNVKFTQIIFREHYTTDLEAPQYRT